MSGTIVFYGSLAERLGRRVAFAIPPGGITVAELRQNLARTYPDAAGELTGQSLRACVADMLAAEEFVVQPGDTVEFFPPVSGG